eukprot:gene19483-22150_t
MVDVAEALHRYIEGGSTLEALSIISQCTNGQIVNSWDQVKEIPLTKAAQSGQHSILQALIDHPFIEADMLLRPKCALYYAVCNGDLESVHILLGHPGYAPQDWTRICVHALRWGQVNILHALFSHPTVTEAVQSAVKFEATNNKWKISSAMLRFFETGKVNNDGPGRSDSNDNEEMRESADSWLAAELLRKRFDPALVRNVEHKLVVQEGIVTAELFASLPAADLTFAYLDRIGIVGKGLQLELMQLHRTLQLTAIGVSMVQKICNLETRMNELATELQAFKASYILEEDNTQDPVLVTDP